MSSQACAARDSREGGCGDECRMQKAECRNGFGPFSPFAPRVAAVMNAECRRQNAKLAALLILHSAFCLLHFGCAARSRESRETLEFWGLGREGEVVADMIPEFERRNPGIHVVFQQIPW